VSFPILTYLSKGESDGIVAALANIGVKVKKYSYTITGNSSGRTRFLFDRKITPEEVVSLDRVIQELVTRLRAKNEDAEDKREVV